MGINAFQGAQCAGNVALSSGSLTGSIPIYAGGRNTSSAYTLAAAELLCVLSLLITSTDTVTELVTVTDGAPTYATVLFKGYVNKSAPLSLQVPPGVLFGFPATNLVATAGAVSAGKSVGVELLGLVVTRA